MADIKMETSGLTLIKPEDSADQQLMPVQQESVKQEETDQHNFVETIVDDVKDSDLVTLENNQALTTSLKVAEYFGKQHRRVIQTIEDKYKDLHETVHMFQKTTVQDSYGREQPVYLMNRDGFTLLAMGFTGEKALKWKIRYIQAFNRMEETLRKQQQEVKPMTLAQQLMVQAQFNIQMEERLDEQATQLAQVQADIKQIKQNNNGMFLRHEITDIKQQQQLDQHETDIQKIQRVISDKGPREEIKTLISAIVTKTADTTEPYSYKEAYEVLYKYIRDKKKIRLSTKLTNLKRLRLEQGWSKTKIEKLSCLDAIDADPAIWGAVRDAVKELWIFLEERTHG